MVEVMRQLNISPWQGATPWVARRTALGRTHLGPLPLPTLYMLVIYTMLHLGQIEGFDWDEGNARKSVEKHDVSQGEAEQIFFNDPLLIVEDVGHSVRELRLHALGRTDAGRLLHVTFTLRGEGRLIRVISARTMHRKERVRYEQES